MNASVLKGGLELIWWVITFIVVYAVLYPIHQKVFGYPFLSSNIVFVIVFLTITRYIFQLKHTFIGKIQWAKMILMVLCIPLVAYLISQVNFFQAYLDENGYESFLGHLPGEEQLNLGKYIRTEMIFFGVGALIASVLFFFRLIMSIWRTHNRDTV